jgi:hypothetical protein
MNKLVSRQGEVVPLANLVTIGELKADMAEPMVEHHVVPGSKLVRPSGDTRFNGPRAGVDA